MQTLKHFKKQFLLTPVLFVLLISGCDNMQEVSIEEFRGTWEIQKNAMFNGIQISIEKEYKKMTGRVVQLNENKYVNQFLEPGDIWISNILRASNFEFRIVEKRLAWPLFIQYDLPSTQEYKVTFSGNDTIKMDNKILVRIK
jgi:hypothetical protein